MTDLEAARAWWQRLDDAKPLVAELERHRKGWLRLRVIKRWRLMNRHYRFMRG